MPSLPMTQYVRPARQPRSKRVSTPSCFATRVNWGAHVGFTSMGTWEAFVMMSLSSCSFSSTSSDVSWMNFPRPTGMRKNT